MKPVSPSDHTLIRARSQRQALDWSLALVSQGIESAVLHADDGWGLQVKTSQLGDAARVLRLYHLENRDWIRYFRPVPHGPAYHTGAFLWGLLLIAVHAVVAYSPLNLESPGICDTSRLMQGEFWRLATAVSLHADLRHLIGNLTFGLVFLGLAMARFGAGWAQLASLLGGVAGNALSAVLHGPGHRGLGASGMVMAALGLLVAGAFIHTGGLSRLRHWLRRGLLGGVLLFLFVGLDPTSDIIAHVGGFITGLALGGILVMLPNSWRSSLALNHTAALTALSLMLLAWFAALSFT